MDKENACPRKLLPSSIRKGGRERRRPPPTSQVLSACEVTEPCSLTWMNRELRHSRSAQPRTIDHIPQPFQTWHLAPVPIGRSRSTSMITILLSSTVRRPSNRQRLL